MDTSAYDANGDLGSTPITLDLMIRLNKDLKQTSVNSSASEIRYLVDLYYSMQRMRIGTNNAVIAMEKSGEANELIGFFTKQCVTMEKQIAQVLDTYTNSKAIGRWSRSVKGIGPVITAGMLTHIDIYKAPTVGHIYSFAGHNPNKVWEKGKKRPWNAKLKVLGWKAGESFVKVSGYDDADYGKLYKFRKAVETARNDSGEYKKTAAEVLTKKKFGKDTKAIGFYEKGMLPPAHIHSRSTRWALQVFWSHLHTVWYFDEFKKAPPRPYVFEHMGHQHYMMPPNLAEFQDLNNILHKQFPHGESVSDWVSNQTRKLGVTITD